MSLFGGDFIRGSSLLSLIILGQFVNISMGSVGLMLQMTGLEKQMRNILIISSLVTFTLYFLFIEKLGLVGLGIVYIFNILFQNFACTYILNKRLSIFLFQKDYLKVLLLFLVLGVFIYLFFNKIIIVASPFLLIILLFSIYYFLRFVDDFFLKKRAPFNIKNY